MLSVVALAPSGGVVVGDSVPKSSVPFSQSRYVVASPAQMVLPASPSRVVMPEAVLAAIWAGV